jgi:hypothetical protein
MRDIIDSFREVLEEKDVSQIQEAISTLEKREQSNNKKAEADLEYKKNNLDKSADIYD